jgi:N6-adenosine-specific RNA methylase IME4
MSKRVKSSAKKKPLRYTFKTLKEAGRALKKKSGKRAAHPLRPSNTRWPAEISIGKRHRKEFGDIEALALSYNERGAIIQPIAITTDDKLIAGERRLKAWLHPRSNFRDQPIPVHVITVDSIVAGEWDENAHRKDFTPSEAVAIKREIEVLLKKHAKDRQRHHGGTTHGKKSDASDKLNVGERAAAMIGKKRRTLEKAEKIEDAAERDPKRFGKLRDDMNRTGRVDGPFKRLQNMQQGDAIKKSPAPLPGKGPYQAIVIDPPWPQEAEADQETIDANGRSLRPYPAMSIQALCTFLAEEVKPILAENCAVGLWVTNHHMRHAFALLHALGIDQHSTIVTWGKDKFGRGQVRRDQTEHTIIGLLGKPVLTLTNQTTYIAAPRRENSQKPDEFYAQFEAVHPAPRYAEIFSRGGRGPNWDCHGDQAEKFNAPAKGKSDKSAKAASRKRKAKYPWPLDEHGNGWPSENGHTVSMTTDQDSGWPVGTCECGAIWRFPRGKRKKLDSEIDKHWIAEFERATAPLGARPPDNAPDPTEPPAGNGEKSAKSAAIPAGDPDQLTIPGFLDRNAPAAEAAE